MAAQDDRLRKLEDDLAQLRKDLELFKTLVAAIERLAKPLFVIPSGAVAGQPLTAAGQPGAPNIWPQEFPLAGNFTIVNPAPDAAQGLPVGRTVVLPGGDATNGARR